LDRQPTAKETVSELISKGELHAAFTALNELELSLQEADTFRRKLDTELQPIAARIDTKIAEVISRLGKERVDASHPQSH
jgi:hypothetical protein